MLDKSLVEIKYWSDQRAEPACPSAGSEERPHPRAIVPTHTLAISGACRAEASQCDIVGMNKSVPPALLLYSTDEPTDDVG
jgi:hypothetical protein